MTGRFLGCLLILLLAAGCASVHSTTSFDQVGADGGRTPVQGLEIENSGWYLLSFIPIASGNPEKPNAVSCRWFSNTVKLENNLRILDREMKRSHITEVANLTSHRSDEKYLVFILARRAYHTSAILLKPEGQPSENGKSK